MMADVLRLDLLSRYGGVWADVTTCPVQPLDSYVSKMTADVGFFAMMWEPFYDRATRGNHTPGALESFDKDGPCVGKHEKDKQGYHVIDNWFLLAPQKHNQIIDTWLDALTTVVKDLPDGAVPCRPKHCAVMGDYVYHLPMKQGIGSESKAARLKKPPSNVLNGSGRSTPVALLERPIICQVANTTLKRPSSKNM